RDAAGWFRIGSRYDGGRRPEEIALRDVTGKEAPFAEVVEVAARVDGEHDVEEGVGRHRTDIGAGGNLVVVQVTNDPQRVDAVEVTDRLRLSNHIRPGVQAGERIETDAAGGGRREQ